MTIVERKSEEISTGMKHLFSTGGFKKEEITVICSKVSSDKVWITLSEFIKQNIKERNTAKAKILAQTTDHAKKDT